MAVQGLKLDRCSLNQATIKKASLATAVSVTAASGIPAIGLWREPVAEVGLGRAAKIVRDSGLRVSSLCRGGYFTSPDGPLRRAEIDDNLRAVDEAAELGAPVLVIVAGGLPRGDRDLPAARRRVSDALAELAPYAWDAGVTLALEPLHPMYVADRAVVSTLGQALDLATAHGSEEIGVAVDTFHLWWDPDLEGQLYRAGVEHRIAVYQVADWITPIAADALLARGIPGDGHIDVPRFTRMIRNSGYSGDVECEVFRQDIWDADPAAVAMRVAAAHSSLVAPFLEPISGGRADTWIN